jgi:hypothetical protein
MKGTHYEALRDVIFSAFFFLRLSYVEVLSSALSSQTSSVYVLHLRRGVGGLVSPGETGHGHKG